MSFLKELIKGRGSLELEVYDFESNKHLYQTKGQHDGLPSGH